jgi:hypothetical protein
MPLLDYRKAWDETRYPVWRQRILATKAPENRKLAAIARAWERAIAHL